MWPSILVPLGHTAFDEAALRCRYWSRTPCPGTR
jgi:hypothetical protein